MLTVIILTHNEAIHIERAIRSVAGIASRIFVVDSGSTDDTITIAKSLGADVLSHPFENHARQFNWALDELPVDTEWVFRLDADEIVTPELAQEIAEKLPNLGPEVAGVRVGRRMTFLGRPIRYGGVFPIWVLRLFRLGRGHCEDRWMDEHIIVTGSNADFRGEILDDNRKSLSWWTEKHNAYASREVVDLLNLECQFMDQETSASLWTGQAGLKRLVKERLYARLPGGLRAFAYFFWRYVLRLGFLDGREGMAFHVLQGLWYRFLVDAKLHQVKQHMRRQGVDAPTAIEDVLEMRVLQPHQAEVPGHRPLPKVGQPE